MATFSKSLASCGGVIAGSAEVIEFLRIASRPFIFTASGVPGGGRRGARGGARLPLRRRAARCSRRCSRTPRYLHDGLARALGLPALLGPTPLWRTGPRSITPVVPVVVGDDWKAVFLWKALYDAGVFVNVALHPAVPPGRRAAAHAA